MPEETPAPWLTNATDIETIMVHMTLEEKIGQVLVIGFQGTELNAPAREMIEQYHIGGVILYARNLHSPLQVAALTSGLQQTAMNSGQPGLLISIDQEGGHVTRLTEKLGFTEFPGAMALAATGDVKNARWVAQALAVEMKAVGINVNLAPVLDVNNNPANPIIGIRSFGSDPHRVAEFGVAYLEGLQSEGLLAFGKHFPGHGDTGLDSHIALPLVPHDRDRLEAVEFVPFQAAMQHNIAGIMSAHITFPAVDPTPGLPATLSAHVLTGLLRDEMDYDGLLITDALEMGALSENDYPAPRAAALALQAGADLLLFTYSNDQPQTAHALIMDWVQNGQIPESRLDQAVRRILQAKRDFNLLTPTLVDVEALATQVNTEEHHALSRAIAIQSITLVRDEAHLLPIEPESPLLIVEPPLARGLGRALHTSAIEGNTATEVAFIEVGENPTGTEIQSVLTGARDGHGITIVAVNAVAQHPQQVALVQALLDAGYPTIVVAIHSPYDLLAFPAAPTCLASYGFNPPAQQALVAVFTGQASPQGQLPVELSKE